jgi:virginiamycin B lyase
MRFLRRLACLLAVLGAARPGVSTNVTFTEYPNLHPYGSLAVGPDGNIWFTDDRDAIVVLSLSGAVVASIPASPGCAPDGITLGPDSRMWYVCTGIKTVGIATYNQGSSLYHGTEYEVPRQPVGFMAVGPNGILWYSTTTGVDEIDSAINVTPTIGGTGESGLASGLDDAIWGVSFDGYIWRRSSSEAYASTPIPTPTGIPVYIADCTAQSGSVYFSEEAGDNIGSATFDGASWSFAEFPLAPGTIPRGIACAADGTVWYAGNGTNKIGYWKPRTGAHEEFSVPSPLTNLQAIAIAPDGSIWFNESNAFKIGKLELRPNGDVNGDGQRDIADVFTVINFLFAGGPAPVP